MDAHKRKIKKDETEFYRYLADNTM
ncbi:uncharacterized protein METZ01_LOCUS403261 [marine metagenome]|uniref:Uncharacterized protein n=1 Tax=marine metagenome TaxID=408172 RepID=A0A382VV71_9ZZZZ